MTRIGIMGTPAASGNRGVQALGAALCRLCLEASGEPEVVLFGSSRDARAVMLRPMGSPQPIPVVHWRLSLRGGFRHHLVVICLASLLYRSLPVAPFRRALARAIPWIGALEGVDLVGDVRGGDSFSDIYGLQRFLIATLPVLSVIAVKGRIVQFPQTYGPYKSRLSRVLARYILRRSGPIFARDKESQRIAQELAGPCHPVIRTPDVAFALFADDVRRFRPLPPDELPTPGTTIGLNVNGLMYNGGYTGRNMFGLCLDYRKFLRELIPALLRVHPGNILLVPHTFAAAGDAESDNGACQTVLSDLTELQRTRVQTLSHDYDAHQLKAFIGQCDFFIGSRMHSCIAALSQGVPCVGVAYSMKFAGVFETVGMKDWVIDGRGTTAEDAVSGIISRYEERSQHRQALASAADAARKQLASVFAQLLTDPTTKHAQAGLAMAGQRVEQPVAT